MHDNLCLYRDVIAYIEERSSISNPKPFGAAIITVDLEKAYDLVNRDVLWEVLLAFGYPSKFVGWMKALYAITSMIILNGNTIAGKLNGVGSIRQGCPLSMHLFALYIDPLLVALTNKLNGVMIQKIRSQPEPW